MDRKQQARPFARQEESAIDKQEAKPFDLALLGFGNAGRAFARLLLEKQEEIRGLYGREVRVTAIATGSRGSLVSKTGVDLARALTEIEEQGRFDEAGGAYSSMNAMEIAARADYDALAELTPLAIFFGQPAIDHIKTALERKRHALTANKGPIAWAYRELRDLARKNGVRFLYETTVMDGAPIFNLVEETLPLCRVTEVKGILNSTTNFILEELAKCREYEEAISEGKERGFVEADPSMDVEGYDAAAKTAALLNVLMDAGLTPNDIRRKGIGDITQKEIRDAETRGNVIKLLCHGFLENGKAAGRVAPAEIPKTDLLAGIRGTSSIVSITTDLMGTLSIVEHEPEIGQTAYGIFSDVLRLLK